MTDDKLAQLSRVFRSAGYGEKLHGSARDAQNAAIRQLFCHFAHNELDIPLSEIAEATGMSNSTVSAHAQSFARKLRSRDMTWEVWNLYQDIKSDIEP